ncbi:MAG: hypothetical protein QOK11_1856 [Pseudonocardiales bacterium]|nr:hypothetical protein [Pseudonocardiales bacterium]
MSRRNVVNALLVLLIVAASGFPTPARADTAGTVSVQTVPALGGVRLAVGGTLVTTGSDGSASARVSSLNGVAATVRLADQQLDATTRLTLGKVAAAPHTLPHESHLSVGLDVTSLVRLNIEAGKTGVAPSSVHLMRLHSATGQVLNVDPQVNRQVWLLARRTQLAAGTLTTRTVTWSVDRVSSGPGVALTTATPRFDPYRQLVWNLELQTVHGTVEIATVPATAGVQFLLDGATVTTGRDGTASAPVSDLNAVDQRLTLQTRSAGEVSVALLHVNRLKPLAVHQRRLLASLSVFRPVTLRFEDLQGLPVDPARITQVRLEGGGSIIRLDGSEILQPVSLLALHATEAANVWQARRITYSMSVVRLDGSNAVFRGRQRFDPNSSGVWPVRLAVFSLTVTAHDVLFGAGVSSRVSVTRPDGSAYTVRLGAGSATVLTSMVRGLYAVDVHEAVVGARTTVLVSRNDRVDVRVMTPLDAVVIALAGLLLVVAAVLGGRRLARRRDRGDTRDRIDTRDRSDTAEAES